MLYFNFISFKNNFGLVNYTYHGDNFMKYVFFNEKIPLSTLVLGTQFNLSFKNQMNE